MIGQDELEEGPRRREGALEVLLELATTSRFGGAALAKGIQARGGTLESPPEDRAWNYRDFSMTDPDGFKLTFGTPIKKRS